MLNSLKVAVLGASGAVGQEFLKLFKDRQFPVGDLLLLASERSAGQEVRFQGEPVQIQRAVPEVFENIDIAFFSAGASRSKEFAPHALRHGAYVIDNSSAFRMDPNVPLVIPEINGSLITAEQKLYSNPNCSAIIMLMAVAPLCKLGKIDRIVVSTYQSASGAGAKAMAELENQTRDVLNGKPAIPEIMPHVYAFNLFSHNTPVNEHGYNEEEWKVIEESRKILNMPKLRINVTCIRVPVLRAHSESITVEFAGEAPSLDTIRETLSSSTGVRVVDDRTGNHFPMPLEASGQDDVLVGRLRRDISHPSAVSLFVAGDQLLKGAALNAVQIAEQLPIVARARTEPALSN